jgi:hypothetical protein
MNHVYHFTSIARLPWIIEAGQLRPGSNKIAGYPDPDFLWASTSDKGSRSAAIASGMPVVRFTLNAEDFEEWLVIRARYPAWTPDQIKRVELAPAARGDLPSTWRCRVDPLPLNRVLATEIKGWDTGWKPLTDPVTIIRAEQDPVLRGLVFGHDVHLSRQIVPANGVTRYEYAKVAKHTLEKRPG